MNKQEIFKMLREESGAFATEDDDIECAAQLKLEINLRNDNPVQKHTQFNSQALVWRGKETPAGYDQSWMDKQIEVTLIIPSCVREGKRWQSETVNYRQLKCKIEDDCQPIPRIRDILNSLSGDTYFSVLDQGKPYDQDIMTMILCQEGFCCSPTSWLLRTCWKPFRKGITWKALFTLGRGNTCNSGTHIYRPSLSSKPKHDRGKQRVLQWNLFLPCDVLPLSKQSLVKDHPIAI